MAQSLLVQKHPECQGEYVCDGIEGEVLRLLQGQSHLSSNQLPHLIQHLLLGGIKLKDVALQLPSPQPFP